MMYSNTNLIFTFKTATAARKAKGIAKEALLSLKDFEFYYSDVPEKAASNLTVRKNLLLGLVTYTGFLGSELIEVVPIIVKAIAAKLQSEEFSFDTLTSDRHTEAWVDGKYEDRTLDIKTTYYPKGYHEYLSCPECGMEVVRVENYKPRKKSYVCPDCKKKVDLSKAYEASKPVIEKKVIVMP